MAMGKTSSTDDTKYPPVYLEALAYHEAGHAVMAVLLSIPVKKIAIGSACKVPKLNAVVDLDSSKIENISILKSGLILVASEPAEKLAPNYRQFAKLHKKYRHLPSFRIGSRSDRAIAFNQASGIYQLLGFAKSTATQQFKEQFRDRANQLINSKINSDAVHRLASALMTKLKLSGRTAKSIILADGPLNNEGLLAETQ